MKLWAQCAERTLNEGGFLMTPIHQKNGAKVLELY